MFGQTYPITTLKCPMHSANLQAYMWLLSGLINGKHRKLAVSMSPCNYFLSLTSIFGEARCNSLSEHHFLALFCGFFFYQEKMQKYNRGLAALSNSLSETES